MEKLNDVTPALAGPRTQRSRSRRKPGGGGRGAGPAPSRPPGYPQRGRGTRREPGEGARRPLATVGSRWGRRAAPSPAGSLRPERGSPGEHHRNQGLPPSLPPRPAGRAAAGKEARPEGAAQPPSPSLGPRAGGPPETAGKSLSLPGLCSFSGRPAAPGARQREGGRGEGPPPPATAAPRPRTCTHAEEQRRAALPCSSHSPWLKATRTPAPREEPSAAG